MAIRSRLAPALDILIVLALVLTLAIVLTGGFFTRAGGFRISGRSPDRALLLALGLAAVRLLVDRRTPFLNRAPGYWSGLRERWLQRGADPISSTPASWGQLALAAAGICAVGAVLLYPQLRAMYWVPDLGDPLFSIWRMGWVYRQLLGDPRPLFDANIFHPEPLTLTYSDSMLLPSLAAAPLFAAGVHPVLAYNIIFLASFAFAGLATFTLVTRLTGSAPAAFIAGLIYGFYPYRFEHYSHLELQITGWMPLGLIALHRFAERQRLRDAALFALAGAAQLYSAMYYGVFFALYAAAVGVVLLRWRGVPLRQWLPTIALAGTVAVMIAIPLARPYVAAQARKGDRDTASVEVFSAMPADYLRAHSRSARYGRITLPGRQVERALFPGLTPIAFTAIALVPPLGITRAAYLAGLAIAFDGSLGFNGITYEYFYDWFLPIRGLRVPARFSIVAALSLAVLAGFGVRRLLRSVSARRAQALFAVLVVAVAVDLQPLLPLVPVWRTPPPIYAGLDGTRAVLGEFPLERELGKFGANLPYMYFSFWHGASMVNGYSGFPAPTYEELASGVAGFPDAESLALLRGRGVTHLTVNCAFYGNRCHVILDELDRTAGVSPIARGLWEGEPVALYELQR